MKLIRVWACCAVMLAGMSQAFAEAVANSIETLTVGKAGGAIEVRVGMRSAPSALPANFSIANPARIVFDFPATENGLGYGSKNINEGGLRSFNLVQAGDRSRLVLNLDRVPRFEARQDGKDLVIRLLDGGDQLATPTNVEQHFSSSESARGSAVRDIQFRRNKEGAGVVVVDLSTTDAAIDVRQKGASLLVAFKDTRLPDALLRRLDVVDFATPITAVNTRKSGDDVLIEIVPKGLWEHTAFQSDNQFIVEVRPVKEDPNKLFQGSRSGYQGEIISLNFQNIPLRELLHVFADITNFNIVISDTVAGNVSLRLNDVPWDQALDIVLQQKNLAMRKNGNVVWIAPADELAAKEKTLLESKQQIAELEPLRTERFILNYHQAEELQKMLEVKSDGGKDSQQAGSFLSARGKVAIDKRSNSIFVTDAPTALDRVRELIVGLDKPASQVLIEARIVEANDDFSSNIGVRLGTTDFRGATVGHRIAGSDSVRFGVGAQMTALGYMTGQAGTQPLMAPVLGTSGTAGEGLNVNLPVNNSNAGALSFSLFNSSKTQFLNLELTALETDGRGKVVSSPRVVTADKVEAVIEQGVELPYLQATSSGAANVAYKKANLTLKVKPQITPDGRVRMMVAINKDSPNLTLSERYGVPVDTKHITTEVIVENGGTVVIGGIYTQKVDESTTRIPLLGDLPVVGNLFKQRQKSDKRTELLIFLTPKVLNDTLEIR